MRIRLILHVCSLTCSATSPHQPLCSTLTTRVSLVHRAAPSQYTHFALRHNAWSTATKQIVNKRLTIRGGTENAADTVLLCLATYPSPLFHVSAYAQTTGGCVCEDGDTCDSNDLFEGKKWCWATHACQRGLRASTRVWGYCTTPTVFPRSSVVLEKMTVQACTSGTTFSPVFVTSGFGKFEFHNTHVKDNRATGLFMSGGVGTAVGNSVSIILGCLGVSF